MGLTSPIQITFEISSTGTGESRKLVGWGLSFKPHPRQFKNYFLNKNTAQQEEIQIWYEWGLFSVGIFPKLTPTGLTTSPQINVIYEAFLDLVRVGLVSGTETRKKTSPIQTNLEFPLASVEEILKVSWLGLGN